MYGSRNQANNQDTNLASSTDFDKILDPRLRKRAIAESYSRDTWPEGKRYLVSSEPSKSSTMNSYNLPYQHQPYYGYSSHIYGSSGPLLQCGAAYNNPGYTTREQSKEPEPKKPFRYPVLEPDNSPLLPVLGQKYHRPPPRKQKIRPAFASQNRRTNQGKFSGRTSRKSEAAAAATNDPAISDTYSMTFAAALDLVKKLNAWEQGKGEPILQKPAVESHLKSTPGDSRPANWEEFNKRYKKT